MAVSSYAVDLMLDGAKQSYQIMIFSSKNNEIAKDIHNQLGRGVTALTGKGWFSQQTTEVLLVIVRKQQKPKVLKIVKDIDETAFLSVSKVTGVFGKNFDELKI